MLWSTLYHLSANSGKEAGIKYTGLILKLESDVQMMSHVTGKKEGKEKVWGHPETGRRKDKQNWRQEKQKSDSFFIISVSRNVDSLCCQEFSGM